jgi:hypothetical protein
MESGRWARRARSLELVGRKTGHLKCGQLKCGHPKCGHLKYGETARNNGCATKPS